MSQCSPEMRAPLLIWTLGHVPMVSGIERLQLVASGGPLDSWYRSNGGYLRNGSFTLSGIDILVRSHYSCGHFKPH